MPSRAGPVNRAPPTPSSSMLRGRHFPHDQATEPTPPRTKRLKLDKLVVLRLRRSEAPHGQLEAPGENPCGAAHSGSQGPLAPLVFTASGAAVSMPWPPLAAAQKGSSLSRTLGWPWATGSVWGCPSATSGHRGDGSREAGPDAGVGHAALRGWALYTGGSRARCPQRRLLLRSAPGSETVRRGRVWGAGRLGHRPGRQGDRLTARVNSTRLSSMDTRRGHRARA